MHIKHRFGLKSYLISRLSSSQRSSVAQFGSGIRPLWLGASKIFQRKPAFFSMKCLAQALIQSGVQIRPENSSENMTFPTNHIFT